MEEIMENEPKNLKKGWELIAEAFAQKGVEYLFTVPGESISPIQRAAEASGIPIVSARHEQAATFMAETYGRMTGKPGLVAVTFGPGFTNALSAIQNANLSNSPLILMAGAHGAKSPDRLGLQDMKQEPIIESIVKKSLVCRHTERLPDYIDMAFRCAAGGRPGPVFLELPIDVLDGAVESENAVRLHTSVESRPIDPNDVVKMMSLIKESQKPVIMAGSGAYFSQAGPELTGFVEKAGIPVFTGKFGRGIVSDAHPMCFESSVGLRPGAAALATIDSDCIILLGNRLCLYNATGDLYRRDAKIIQVDIEPEEIGRNRSVDAAIFGDIKRLLQGCNQWIDAQGAGEFLRERFTPWVAQLQEENDNNKELSKFHYTSDQVPIHPARLAKEIDRFMDRPDDIIVYDGGDMPTWMLSYRTCVAPWNEMASGLYGCLGCGLPYAAASKLIRPQSRVMLCTGDGSIGFSFMELETCVRKGLSIVVVIGNNNLWGMTANSMKLKFKRHIPDTVELNFVPYHKLMEAIGIQGFFVENPADIGPALEAAFDAGGPAIVNVMTDPGIMGPGSAGLAMIAGNEF